MKRILILGCEGMGKLITNKLREKGIPTIIENTTELPKQEQHLVMPLINVNDKDYPSFEKPKSKYHK